MTSKTRLVLTAQAYCRAGPEATDGPAARMSHNAAVSAPGPGLKLHLGCGSTVVPGWENLDKSPGVVLARVPGLRRALLRAGFLSSEQADAIFPPGIIRVDVRRGLPYPTASARYLYSSHMIEHMARWQALELVRECARVLEPRGALRFATPDLAVLVEGYAQGNGNESLPRAGLLSWAGWERSASVPAAAYR